MVGTDRFRDDAKGEQAGPSARERHPERFCARPDTKVYQSQRRDRPAPRDATRPRLRPTAWLSEEQRTGQRCYVGIASESATKPATEKAKRSRSSKDYSAAPRRSSTSNLRASRTTRLHRQAPTLPASTPVPDHRAVSHTGPTHRMRKRLTDSEPVSKRPQSMQPDMTYHLGSPSFRPHLPCAVNVHLGDAFLPGMLLA